MATNKRKPAQLAAKESDAAVVDEKLAAAMNKAAEFEDKLASFTDADAAMEALSTVFGGIPYANAAALAIDGTEFYCTAAIFEPGEGYKGADRWNVSIVSQFGEPFALTLGANPTRAGFMTALAKVIDHFGRSGRCKLQAIGGKDVDEFFYVIVPADKWSAPDQDIIEALAERAHVQLPKASV